MAENTSSYFLMNQRERAIDGSQQGKTKKNLPELHELYGDEFEARYIELEEAGRRHSRYGRQRRRHRTTGIGFLLRDLKPLCAQLAVHDGDRGV
ncbi:hypothetical protein [Caballeronia grimmiae]|uniref:hypothetical protein n=1 Tax=Caballeronia grimmiae TaxID=1071679 RepID=UPI0038BB5F49